MLVQFDSLPESSRVYYYPSSRKFYPDEIPVLTSKIEAFCQGLGDIQIAYRFTYDRFVIFFVSENTPLSIEHNDELVEFVLDLEKEFEVNLLDKVNACFKQGEFVQRKVREHLQDLREGCPLDALYD